MKKLIIFLLLTLSSYAQQQDWFWQNPYPQGNDLRDVSFIDSLHGWAAGDYGTIIRTTDGGLNWSVIYFDPKNLNNTICFIDEYKGFIGGDSGKKILIGFKNRWIINAKLCDDAFGTRLISRQIRDFREVIS